MLVLLLFVFIMLFDDFDVYMIGLLLLLACMDTCYMPVQVFLGPPVNPSSQVPPTLL